MYTLCLLSSHFNILSVKKCDLSNRPSTSTAAGRPLKVFAELSTPRNLRYTLEGKRAAARIISRASEFSPKRAIKIKKS